MSVALVAALLGAAVAVAVAPAGAPWPGGSVSTQPDWTDGLPPVAALLLFLGLVALVGSLLPADPDPF